MPRPAPPTWPPPVGRLLRRCREHLHQDPDRGLDHGAYVPLCRDVPEADIPVLQLDAHFGPAAPFALPGRRLAPLRDEGTPDRGPASRPTTCAGSTPRRRADGTPPTPSSEFDHWAAETMAAGDADSLLDSLAKAPLRTRPTRAPSTGLRSMSRSGAADAPPASRRAVSRRLLVRPVQAQLAARLSLPSRCTPQLGCGSSAASGTAEPATPTRTHHRCCRRRRTSSAGPGRRRDDLGPHARPGSAHRCRPVRTGRSPTSSPTRHGAPLATARPPSTLRAWAMRRAARRRAAPALIRSAGSRPGAADLIQVLGQAPGRPDTLVFLEEAPARQGLLGTPSMPRDHRARPTLGAVRCRPLTAADAWFDDDLALDGIDELLIGFWQRGSSRSAPPSRMPCLSAPTPPRRVRVVTISDGPVRSRRIDPGGAGGR